ncbi:MAG: hypothetical protein LH647_08190 [Leptolyngbyaceae cyanobacterium CAN_BIN12]|nr:hypothetical protein [Leptolyngbyaceae cyanobacterium CAN_BIN12]
MAKRCHLAIGLLAVVALSLVEPTFARPALREVEIRSPSNAVTSTPLCYIQIQGGGVIDVTSICGKNPSNSSTTLNSTTPLPPTNIPAIAPPPPNFSPAATAGKCNFLDASGKPCPKTDADKPDAQKTETK